MHREKSLCRSGALETLHLAFSSPGWLMRVLRSIVLPPTALMVFLDPEVTGSSAIRPQVVSD